MKLIIGNKNYSTWSLRPWLLLRAFNLPFDEVQESLAAEGIRERFLKYSAAAKVPVLIDGNLTVWDSLAICEYVSEQYLEGRGWPTDPALRAEARSVTAEMHSSFTALRSELPMNCRAIRKLDPSVGALKDIERIDTIWSECRQKYSQFGPWLFGEFSIADCFYAPVALRFATYNIQISSTAQQYASTLLRHKNMVEWVKTAKRETEIIPEDEAGTPC
jgi:glutathione S-transferase